MKSNISYSILSKKFRSIHVQRFIFSRRLENNKINIKMGQSLAFIRDNTKKIQF